MKLRILLAEDNDMNRDMLSRRLARRGHRVQAVADGRAALDAVLADSPDVVLLDLALPVMDGWEVVRRIREAPGVRRTPVVALTAHALEEDRARALAAGCDAFDVKPIDFERLLATLARLTAERAGQGARDAGDR